jgi:hypothetical protein
MPPVEMTRFLLRDGLRIGAAVIVAALAAGGALVSVQGCQLKNCDPSFADIHADRDAGPGQPLVLDVDAGEGRQLDPETWESTPMDGVFKEFPGQRYVNVYPPFPGPYSSIVTYVSADPWPSPPIPVTDSGDYDLSKQRPDLGNFTVASGNIAEIASINYNPFHPTQIVGFTLHNDSCAQYYMRVVVTRGIPDAAPQDAAVDAPIDAPVDSSSDAPSDGAADALDAGAG